MTVRQLLDSGKFSVIHEGDETEREITVPFCCDLGEYEYAGSGNAGGCGLRDYGRGGCFGRDCPEKGTAAGNYCSGHRAACI